MELPDGFEPADLDLFRILDDDGEVAGLIGLSMTLYIGWPWSPDRARAFYTAVDAAFDRLGADLNWVIVSGKPGFKRYRDVAPLRVADRPDAYPAEGTFSLEAHSGENESDAGHFSLALASPNAQQERLGFVTVTLPISWLTRQPQGAFQDMVRWWCDAIKPIHGSAGLAAIHNPNYAVARIAAPYIFPLVDRFPGLDYDMPVSHRSFLSDGFKCVNWLTIVSDELLQRIGGRAGLLADLDARSYPILDWDGGVVIQAGPAPLLGDSEAKDIPEAYRTVGSLLKPLRGDYPYSIIATPVPIDAKEYAQRWLARFDE